METRGPTQSRIFVPHHILLLQFGIHGKNKCSWMIQKDNTLLHMYNRSILEGNVTYIGEEEPNGSFMDTWLDSPYIYDIYDTNDGDSMIVMTQVRYEG